MHTRELVQKIAAAKKSGERVAPSHWRRLGERIFYVPLQTVRNSDEAGGAKKIRFLTRDRNGQRTVPVFSTEDQLFEWSNGSYQFLPIAGADLVLAVSHELDLEFDPGTEHSFTIAEAEMQLISSEEEASPEEPAEAEPAAEEVQNPAIERPPAPRLAALPPAQPVVEERLGGVLRRYPAVAEGYFLGSEESNFGGLLGLLILPLDGAGSWDTEKRFALVEEIAELARELYGYAGAIEVYDDLANEISRSWDLFMTQHLFYRRTGAGESDQEIAAPPAEIRSGAKAVRGMLPRARVRQNERK